MTKTVEELVLTMLHEVPEGDEVSTTGLIINSLRTLEEAIECVLQDFQFRDIITKRWRPETQNLVYILVPERRLMYDHNDTTNAEAEIDDDPFGVVKQISDFSQHE